MTMGVTCYLSGRFGNIIFALANMFAYAKKHGLDYYVPDTAMAYNHFRDGDIRTPIDIKSTGDKPINPIEYNEPYYNGCSYYHNIPKMDNVNLEGYYQSFKYFDWCRDYILDTFNFPYEMEKGVTSISVRRGDCLEAPDKFPIAPLHYYQNAVRYMQERGFNKFKIHSDDLEWCKLHFTKENFGDAEIEFYDGNEMESYLSLCNCENNITARSTFSLTAAWFNRNLDKIVLVPTIKHLWWGGMNKDLLTDTNFIEIDFNDLENTLTNG